VLSALVARKMPKLAAHLARIGSDAGALLAPWLAGGLFSTVLPSEVVARLFDALLLEGGKVLLRLSLALLRTFEAPICASNHPGQLRKVLDARAARASSTKNGAPSHARLSQRGRHAQQRHRGAAADGARQPGRSAGRAARAPGGRHLPHTLREGVRHTPGARARAGRQPCCCCAARCVFHALRGACRNAAPSDHLAVHATQAVFVAHRRRVAALLVARPRLAPGCMPVCFACSTRSGGAQE
jgi:hypothetical protein